MLFMFFAACVEGENIFIFFSSTCLVSVRFAKQHKNINRLTIKKNIYMQMPILSAIKSPLFNRYCMTWRITLVEPIIPHLFWHQRPDKHVLPVLASWNYYAGYICKTIVDSASLGNKYFPEHISFPQYLNSFRKFKNIDMKT